MGYRLYVYEKGKENYDLCLLKFYSYADYEYVKPSWEYLWPRVAYQITDSFYDENEYEDAYESLHISSFKCVVHAIIFRKFIDRYIMGRNKWVMNTTSESKWPHTVINMNDPEWIKLKELYNSDCDKVLDWG